jgi:hypothetical protein
MTCAPRGGPECDCGTSPGAELIDGPHRGMLTINSQALLTSTSSA